MRYYLSGPSHGLCELNFPAFKLEAARLRNLGYEVISAVDINASQQDGLLKAMRKSLKAMLECDGVICMRGWQVAKASALEVYVARGLAMPVLACEDLTQRVQRAVAA